MSSTQVGPEETITNLITFFGLKMAAALDVQDAFYGDSIVLQDIAEYREVHLPSTDEWPNIVFYCTNSTPVLDARQNRLYVHQIGADIGLVSRFTNSDSLLPQDELIRRINRTEEAARAVLESDDGKYLVIGGVRECSRLYYMGADRPTLREVTDPDLEYEVVCAVSIEVHIALDI